MFKDIHHKPEPVHLRYSKKGSIDIRCLGKYDFLDEGVCTRDCANCEYGKDL